MKTPVPGVMQIHHMGEAGQAAAAAGAPPPTARKVVPASTSNPLHHPSSVAAAPTTFAQQQQSRLMRIPPFDVNSSEMIRAIVVVMKAIRPDASTATEVKEAVHTALLSFQPVSDVYNAYEDGSCYRPRQPVGSAPPVPQPGGVTPGQLVKAVDPVDMVSRFPFLVPGGIVELVNLIMESIDRADDADIAVKCAEGQTSTMTRLAATALMVCEEARQHWKRAHANVIRDMLPFIRTAQAVVVLGSGQLLGKILARGAMECVRFYILEGSPELPAERMRRRERDRDAGVYSSAHHNDEEDASDFDSSISSNTAVMRPPMPMTARGAPSDTMRSPISPLSSGSPRGPAAHHVPSSNNVSYSPFVHGWSEDLVVRGRGSGVNLLNEVQYQAAKLCGLLPNKGDQLSAEDQERLESVRLRIFKSCVIVPDSLMASVLGMSDFSLVGAYGVTESGGIVHRSGSYQLALLSKALNKPLYVACESFKFTRETHCYPAASSDIAQPQTLQEEEERAVLSTHFCTNNDIASAIPAPAPPPPPTPVAVVPTPKVAAKSAAGAPSRTGAAAARPKGKSISSAPTPTAVVVAPLVPVPVAAPFVPSFTPSSEMSATVALGLTLGVQPSSYVADQLRKSIRREATESPIVCDSPVSLSPSTEPLALPAAATATSTASKATAARRGKGNTATPSLKVDLTGQASPKKGSSPQTTPAKSPSTTTTSTTTRRMNVTLPSSSSSAPEPPQSPTTRKKFKSFHSSSVHMIDRMEDDALAAEGSIGSASNNNNTGGGAAAASSSNHHHSDLTSSSQKSASAGRTKLSGGGGGGGMGPRSVSHSHFSVTDTTSRGRTTGAGNSGGGGGAGSGGSGSSFRAGGGFAFIQSPFLHSTSKSDLTSLGGSMGASGMFPGTPASGMQGMFPQSSSNEFVRSLTDNTRGGGGGSGSGGGGSSSVGGNSPEVGGGAFTAGGGLSGCNPQGEDGSPMMMMTTSTKGQAASIAYLGFTQPWDSKRAPPPMLELVPNDLITLFFTDKALMPPAGIVHHFYNTTGNTWWSSVVKPASQ